MSVFDEDELHYRRRALYTGLKLFLNHDALFAALCVWQREFSDQPRFAISKFMNYIVNEFDLSSRRSELQTSLSRLLMAPLDALDEDPIEKMQIYATKKGHPCNNSTGTDSASNQDRVETVSNTVFRAFLAELEKRWSYKNPEAKSLMISAMIARLGQLKLELPERRALESWLKNRAGAFKHSLEESLMQQLINAVYVELCGHLGPLATDTLFGEVLQSVSQTEAGARYSPRKLM